MRRVFGGWRAGVIGTAIVVTATVGPIGGSIVAGAAPVTGNTAGASVLVAAPAIAPLLARTTPTGAAEDVVANRAFAKSMARLRTVQPTGRISHTRTASGSSGWTVQAVPSPEAPDGQLNGISCGDPTDCIAVGAHLDNSGAMSALAERWEGAHWQIVPAPAPAGSLASALFSVDCPVNSPCLAVGSYVTADGLQLALAEMWSGSAWSVVPTADVDGSTGDALDSVSCPTSGACVAVGSSATVAATVPLAETWDGTTWSVAATPSHPDPGSADWGSLAGVSCPNWHECLAVGSYETATATAPMAEIWNGYNWSVAASVAPASGSSGELTSVACPSSSSCMAVGDVTSADDPMPLSWAERWTNSTWTALAVPMPATASMSGLDAIACPSVTSCTAVGQAATLDPTDPSADGPGAGNTDPIAASWNGTAWTTTLAAIPGSSSSSELNGISCQSSSACVAVGSETVGPATVGLAERASSGHWTVVTSPSSDGPAPTELFGIACPAATRCVAVGDTGSISTAPLAELWTGARWVEQSVPAPAGALSSTLSSVSCPSLTACTAVGYTFDADGSSSGLVETWNGSRWTIRPSAGRPADAGDFLDGVSCSSVRACTAVGFSFTQDGSFVSLVETWNGSRWTIVRTVDPSGSQGTFLDSVACPTAGHCTTVGAWESSSGEVTLAEAWNGRTWSVEPTANPANASFTGLEAVACPSASRCVATGSSWDLTTQTPVAEVWNGRSWTLQAAPAAPGASSNDLPSVSCPTATSCVAVGSYSYGPHSSFDPGVPTMTLGEVWNGRSWSRQATAVPTGAEQSALYSVACPTAARCFAVGTEANSGLSPVHALAERYAR